MKTEQKPNRPLHIATEVFRWLSSAYYFPGAVTDVVTEETTNPVNAVAKKTETNAENMVFENIKKD